MISQETPLKTRRLVSSVSTVYRTYKYNLLHFVVQLIESVTNNQQHQISSSFIRGRGTKLEKLFSRRVPMPRNNWAFLAIFTWRRVLPEWDSYCAAYSRRGLCDLPSRTRFPLLVVNTFLRVLTTNCPCVPKVARERALIDAKSN